MNTEQEKQIREIKQELDRLGDEVDQLAKREKDIGVRLHDLQKQAYEAGENTIVQATRHAFIRLNEAGALLVQLHMDLNIPPTTFEPHE